MDSIAPHANEPPNALARPSWPRRIWRFPLTRIVLGIAMALASIVAVQLSARLAFSSLDERSKNLVRPVVACLAAAASCLAYAAFVRWTESRRASELRLERAPLEFVAGSVVGGVLMSVVIGIMYAVGAYRVVGTNSPEVLLRWLAIAIITGVWEETAFRCVTFRILEEWLGSGLALLISAAFFGFAHAFNDGATVASCLAIAVEAGILLGAAFMLTRRLWLVAGMHFAWNFSQGGIFGAAVSGDGSDDKLLGLLQPQFSGPDWLTGGSFGPESSVITVVVCTAAGLALLALAARRGSWVASLWVRRRRVTEASNIANSSVEQEKPHSTPLPP